MYCGGRPPVDASLYLQSFPAVFLGHRLTLVVAIGQKCKAMLAKLKALCETVGPRLGIVYVSRDVNDDGMKAGLVLLPKSSVAVAPSADDSALRRACGQSLAVVLPSLVMMDAGACVPLGTDGTEAFARGVYTAESFSSWRTMWRTNCFRAEWDGRVSSSSATLHPDAVLQAGMVSFQR